MLQPPSMPGSRENSQVYTGVPAPQHLQQSKNEMMRGISSSEIGLNIAKNSTTALGRYSLWNGVDDLHGRLFDARL